MLAEIVGGQREHVVHLHPPGQRPLPRRHALRRPGGQGLVHPLPPDGARARTSSSRASATTRRSRSRSSTRPRSASTWPGRSRSSSRRWPRPTARSSSARPPSRRTRPTTIPAPTSGSSPTPSAPVPTGWSKTTSSERIVFERFEDYHRGWDGQPLRPVIFRVVPENATRRQLLEQGEADAATNNLTPEDFEALKADPDAPGRSTYPSTRVDWAIMNAPRLLTPEARQGFSYAFPYDEVIDGVYAGLLKRIRSDSRHRPRLRPERLPLPDRPGQGEGADPRRRLRRGRHVRLHDRQRERNERRRSPSSSRPTSPRSASTSRSSQVDSATLDDTVYGDAPAEEQPHFIGSWGWWPDYNDPWNQLCAELPRGGHRRRRQQRRRLGQRALRGDHGRGRRTTPTRRACNELMKEAQNILTEQDPPAIYYGQRLLHHGAPRGHPGLRRQPALPRVLPLLRDVPRRERVLMTRRVPPRDRGAAPVRATSGEGSSR